MMTDEQKSTVAELKRSIAAAATADGAPREVRVAAESRRGERRGSGTPACELAAELCVHESTLCRWEREAGGDVVMARGRAPAHGTATVRGKVVASRKRQERADSKRKDRTPPFRMVEVT